MSDLGVGIIGTGFVADLHLESYAHDPRVSVRALAGTSADRARPLAARHGVPHVHGDYRELLARDDVDMVSVCVPNHLHREIVVAAAQAGKHVVCEKPLARTLADADAMIAACDEAGVKLMYGEMICFAPKYVRAKRLVEDGALGRLFQAKHGEQHFGPHADWFWDGERAGGGVLMDMGCHGIEIIRWLFDKPALASVNAEIGTFAHADRTDVEDHAVVTLRFAGDQIGIVETSWAKPGGMHDGIELIGDGGVSYVDLLRGSSLVTYSESGYDYAVEKAATTRGWTFTMYEETWNYGFPQELRHFADCVLDDREPLETAADGRVVLEAVYAAYRAAGTGRRVSFPLEISDEEAALPPYRAWRDAGVSASS